MKKKYGKFIIPIKDYQWKSPSELGDLIQSYLDTLNSLSGYKENFNSKVLSEFHKGDTKLIVLLTEWDEEG